MNSPCSTIGYWPIVWYVFEVAVILIRCFPLPFDMIPMLTHGGCISHLVPHHICMCAFIYARCYVLTHSGCMSVSLLNLCLLVPSNVSDLLWTSFQLNSRMFLFSICMIRFLHHRSLSWHISSYCCWDLFVPLSVICQYWANFVSLPENFILAPTLKISHLITKSENIHGGSRAHISDGAPMSNSVRSNWDFIPWIPP